MLKKIKVSLILVSLIIIYIYVLVIDGIVGNYVIFKGEVLPIKTIFGLNIEQNNQTVETIANNGQKIDDVRK